MSRPLAASGVAPGEKVNAGRGHRVQVIRHALGEGEHHGKTADERGVHKVAAETAEEHLDDDDGDEVADEELPDGHRHGDVVGDEHAGNDRGEIGNGLLLLEELVPYELEQHAVGGGDRHEQQRARKPKIMTDAMSAGMSAMSTSRMTRCVVAPCL